MLHAGYGEGWSEGTPLTATPCPNGRTWDAFVLGLPGTDMAALTAHLESCRDCQALVADRQAYYSDLARLAGVTPAEGGQRPLPASVTLTPLNLVEIPSQSESVMAAAGSAEAAPPPSTFASDDRRWMVKVVWDTSTGHERLFLLSSDGSPVAGLLVRLSGLSGTFLTDAKGTVDLGRVRWPTSKDARVTVESPAATFTLNAALLPDRDESATLVLSPHNDILKVSMTRTGTTRRLRLEIITLAPDLAGKPLQVVVRSAAGDQIVPLEPVMVLENFEPPGTLEIYLFP